MSDAPIGNVKRNFRSAFYGRVSVRVIEGKKALENLLKDDTIDKSKLSSYCSLYPLPAMYRFVFLFWSDKQGNESKSAVTTVILAGLEIA